jgi:hypothetical protein
VGAPGQLQSTHSVGLVPPGPPTNQAVQVVRRALPVAPPPQKDVYLALDSLRPGLSQSLLAAAARTALSPGEQLVAQLEDGCYWFPPMSLGHHLQKPGTQQLELQLPSSLAAHLPSEADGAEGVPAVVQVQVPAAAAAALLAKPVRGPVYAGSPVAAYKVAPAWSPSVTSTPATSGTSFTPSASGTSSSGSEDRGHWTSSGSRGGAGAWRLVQQEGGAVFRRAAGGGWCLQGSLALHHLDPWAKWRLLRLQLVGINNTYHCTVHQHSYGVVTCV